MITLKSINEDNYKDCINLNPGVENEKFVDPVAYSLAEAWVFYEDSHPLAIYADEELVGYVLMYVGENNPQIINFMIDQRFQKRGYGVEAAKLCIDYLYTEFNAQKISLPVEPENIAGQKLWRKVGFEMSDDFEEGYHFLRLDLTQK